MTTPRSSRNTLPQTRSMLLATTLSLGAATTGTAHTSAPGPDSWREAVGEARAQEIEASWPRTLDAAVARLLDELSAQERARVRTTERDALVTFHLGWGMAIRNRFGLWRGNDDLLVSACGRPCHPDSASMEIIRATWEALHEDDL